MTVVMAGWPGLQGALEALEQDGEKAEKAFPERFLEKLRRLDRESGALMKTELPAGAVSLDGGCFQALWTLGEQAGCGFELELSAIPLSQYVIELSELYGLNPYRIPGRGYVALRQEAPGEGELLLGYTRKDRTRVLREGERLRYLTPGERNY